METSAPKRRRTSPRTSVPVGEYSDSIPEAEAPPASASDPAPSAKRPSFASPTKASLAKHNPDILQKRQQQNAAAAQSNALLASEPGTRDGEEEDVERMLDRQLNPTSGTNAQENGHARPAGKALGSERSGGLKKLGGTMAAPPKRTPNKTRPLPAPGPDDDDPLPNPFLGRALRRSGVGTGLFATEENEEPELPPTPEHPDPEVSTPPSGIHNTPSRRLKRHRSFGKSSPSKSSPLKQLPIRPATSSRGKDLDGDAQHVPASIGHERRASLRRGRQPVDQETAEKEALRDSLMAEIVSLEADLELVTSENRRVWEARAAGKRIERSGRASNLLDVFDRRVLPAEKEKLDPMASWLDMALDPTSFLPFGKPAASLPTLFGPEPEENDNIEAIRSHHPIPMTAEEELPFLQAFTSLEFTSDISMLPRDSPSAPLLHKHTITATSADSKGLFYAVIDMTVNAKTFTITNLRVPRLYPASMEELNPLIERITARDARNSIMKFNVSILSFAMSEWLRESTKRARFWLALDRRLGTKDAIAEAAARARARKKSGKRKKDDSDGDDHGTRAIDGWGDFDPARSEVLYHMGRTAMDLPLPVEPVEGQTSGALGLQVQWRIEFEGSGEAHNRIKILSGMSAECHHADEHRSFGKLSRLFDNMLKGGEEPVAAVETIVALMVGESV